MDEHRIEELKSQAWVRDKQAGRRRFIFREILRSLLLWLGIGIVLPLADRSHSWRYDFSVGLAIIPVFVLGGFLTGKWRWKELIEKYGD